MNLRQLVKTECANFRSSDECCWLEEDATLTDRKRTPAKPFDRPCPVLLGTRCGYFEKCVLPIVQQHSPHAGERTRNRKTIREEREEAACEYMDNNYKIPVDKAGCVLKERGKKRREVAWNARGLILSDPPRLPAC